ncbi:ECF transporter S component [Clostridium sp. D2Q-11]|uniref:ECF transporter S component n=1 Tax=Anaeromonas frigoriresistens TaxID=2683708 RepID=A0A942Z847_9FIRM|nr:ECF transporter S component [Anaeromonas frigoriresistens]MBS4539407.1 ECF transporter S component [Anaeromonas frigoriresistens]
MKNQMTKKLILSSVFIALGLVLPIVFHTIGGGGSMFLPMHIPVLIGGFFLNIPFAVAVGVLTPLLSSLLTGMPPIFPVLPFMAVELATYGAIISLLSKKYNMNIYVSLITSMLFGRIMAGMMVWILATFFMAELPSPIIFIQGAVIKGIPGIMIQLIFIPVIIISIKKYKSRSESQQSDGCI